MSIIQKKKKNKIWLSTSIIVNFVTDDISVFTFKKWYFSLTLYWNILSSLAFRCFISEFCFRKNIEIDKQYIYIYLKKVGHHPSKLNPSDINYIYGILWGLKSIPIHNRLEKCLVFALMREIKLIKLELKRKGKSI